MHLKKKQRSNTSLLYSRGESFCLTSLSGQRKSASQEEFSCTPLYTLKCSDLFFSIR